GAGTAAAGFCICLHGRRADQGSRPDRAPGEDDRHGVAVRQSSAGLVPGRTAGRPRRTRCGGAGAAAGGALGLQRGLTAMPRFIANLSMLFTELPFLERFAAARQAGFRTVEVQFPYDHAAADIRHALVDAGVSLHLINLPAGDWAGGDRGIAAGPARVEEFRDGVAQALAYAGELGVRHLNCLAGLGGTVGKDAQWQTLVANVRHAAAALRALDATLLVEPINRRDVPGFVLGTSAEALRLLEEAGEPNLALQYDVYHMQRSEGE